MNIDRVRKIAGWIVAGAVAAVGLGILFGAVVMWLWNWLMPTIFGLPAITYWQAVGILILCHLLFKGHHQPGYDDHDRHVSAFRSRVKGMLHGDGEKTSPCSSAGNGQPPVTQNGPRESG